MGSLVLSCPLCCCQKLSSVEALREHLLFFVYRPIPCPVCQAPITGLQQLVHHLDIHVEGLQLDNHSTSISGGSCTPTVPLVKDVSVVAHDWDLSSVQDAFVARSTPRAPDLEGALVKKSSSTYSIVDSLIHSGKNTLVQLDLLSVQKELSASGGAESRSSCTKSCRNKNELVPDVQSNMNENKGPNCSIQLDWNSLHVPCSNACPESTSSSIERSQIPTVSEKIEISKICNSKSIQHECCNNNDLTEETNTKSGWNSGTCLVIGSPTASPSMVTGKTISAATSSLVTDNTTASSSLVTQNATASPSLVTGNATASPSLVADNTTALSSVVTGNITTCPSLVTSNTNVSPSVVTNCASLTEVAGAAHKLHSSWTWSTCSEELQGRSSQSPPGGNISSQNTIHHDRTSMQAYVCPNCGAKIVGQDCYFRHLQEHTDEVLKCSTRNERSFEPDINASSPASSQTLSSTGDDVLLYCSNDNHSSSCFPSSYKPCQMEVNALNSRLSPHQVDSVPHQVDSVSDRSLISAKGSETQSIETAQPQSKSPLSFPPIAYCEVSSDDEPQMLASKSTSNDFVNFFSKPSCISDTANQENSIEVVQDESNQSGVDSPLEEILNFEDPSLDGNSCFSYENESLATSKKHKSSYNGKTSKTIGQHSLCTEFNDHSETNSATLSDGLEKIEITKVRKPYLHKKFHHEQKSTVVGHDQEDENGNVEEAEKGGCYIPDIQSVWVSRLNASLAREEPRISQCVEQRQQLKTRVTPNTEKQSSETLMDLEKSTSDNHSSDGQLNVTVSPGVSDCQTSESAYLCSKCPKLGKGGHSCEQLPISSNKNIITFRNKSLSCDNTVSGLLLKEHFSNANKKITDNRSSVAGEVNAACVDTSDASRTNKVDAHVQEFSCDNLSILHNENDARGIISTEKYNNNESKAKFVHSFLEDEVQGGQISSTVSSREECLALPSQSVVTKCDISPSGEIGGSVFGETPATIRDQHDGVSASRTANEESPDCTKFPNYARNSEAPSITLCGVEQQGYSHFFNGSKKTFESHRETDGESSRRFLRASNDHTISLDESNDNVSSILRSAAAVMDGIQEGQQQVSEDSLPENASGTALPLDSTSTVGSAQELEDHSSNIEENRPKLHKCKECSKTFLNVSNHRRHIREVHNPSREYLCSVCTKSFCSLRQLINHKGVHEPQKKFQCNMCDHHCYTAAGIRSHRFQEHKKQKVQSKPFKCSLCAESFVRNFGLQRHILRRHGEKPFPCPHCDKVYTCMENLQNHSLSHSDQNGNLPFVCHSCGSQYKSRFALKRHIAIRHSSSTSNVPKGSSCDVNCFVENEHFFEKSVKYSSKLTDSGDGCQNGISREHLQSLLGKNSVSSSSSFSTDVSLTMRHKLFSMGNAPESNENRISKKERNFIDNPNEVAFQKSLSTQSCLKICTSFPGSIDVSLPSTSTGVKATNGVGVHERGIPSVSGVPSIQSKNELDAGAQIEADRTGRFHCPVCSQSYTRRDTLKVHLRSHSSERPFKCDKCDMTFKRRSVLLTHQDKHAAVSKYLCNLCDKRFRFKISLKHHSCVLRPDEDGSTLRS